MRKKRENLFLPRCSASSEWPVLHPQCQSHFSICSSTLAFLWKASKKRNDLVLGGWVGKCQPKKDLFSFYYIFEQIYFFVFFWNLSITPVCKFLGGWGENVQNKKQEICISQTALLLYQCNSISLEKLCITLDKQTFIAQLLS